MKFTVSAAFLTLAAYSVPSANEFNGQGQAFTPQFNVEGLGEISRLGSESLSGLSQLPLDSFGEFSQPFASVSNPFGNSQVASKEAPITPKPQEGSGIGSKILGLESLKFFDAAASGIDNLSSPESLESKMQPINLSNFRIA